MRVKSWTLWRSSNLKPIASLVLCALLLSADATSFIGSGSSLALEAYTQALFIYQFQNPGAAASQYSGGGSGAGRRALLAGTTDFAGTDSDFSASDYQANKDLAMFPTMATAVSLVYNLPTLAQSDVLVLSREVLPLIYAGNITHWDDAAILALNPNLVARLPHQPIVICVRSDSSGTTNLLTQGLASFSTEWSRRFGIADKISWTAPRVIAAIENRGVASAVVANPWTLGYVALSEAMTRSLPMAELLNRAGNVVAASPSSVAFAVMELGGSLTGSLADAHAAYAYPLSGFTFIGIRKNTSRTTCESRRLMTEFWHWWYTQTLPRTMLGSVGFAALPEVVRDTVVEALQNGVKCPDGSLAFPPVEVTPLTIGGPFLPSRLFNLFLWAYGAVDPSLNLAYAVLPLSSQTEALHQVASGKVPWALQVSTAVDANGSAAELALGTCATDRCGSVAVFPLLLLAVAPIYALPFTVSATQPPLVLSLPVLANIFSGAIWQWNDTSIRELNPQLFASTTIPASTDMRIRLVVPEGNSSEAWHVVGAALARSEPTVATAIKLHGSLSGWVHATSTAELVTVRDDTDTESVVLSRLGTLGLFSTVGGTAATVARTLTAEGRVITANASTVAACSRGTEATLAMPLAHFSAIYSGLSRDTDCWPLTATVSMIAQTAFSATEEMSARRLVNLLRWLFKDSALPLQAASVGAAFASTSLSAQAVEVLEDSTVGGQRMFKGKPVKFQFDTSLQGVTYALTALGALAVLVCAALLFKHRQSPVLRAACIPFLLNLLLGVLLMYAAIPFAGIAEPSAVQCAAPMWLLGTGFCIAFGSLFVKTWRVYRIFSSQILRVIQLTNGQLFAYVGVLLLVEVTILVVWQVVGPLTPTLYLDVSANVSHTTCASSHGAALYGTFFAWKGALFLLSMAVAWLVRHAHDVFNESRHLAVTLYVCFFLLAVLLPLLRLLDGQYQREAYAYVFSLGIFLLPSTILVVMLGPRFVNVYNPNSLRTGNTTTIAVTNGKSHLGSAKADRPKGESWSPSQATSPLASRAFAPPFGNLVAPDQRPKHLSVASSSGANASRLPSAVYFPNVPESAEGDGLVVLIDEEGHESIQLSTDGSATSPPPS